MNVSTSYRTISPGTENAVQELRAPVGWSAPHAFSLLRPSIPAVVIDISTQLRSAFRSHDRGFPLVAPRGPQMCGWGLCDVRNASHVSINRTLHSCSFHFRLPTSHLPKQRSYRTISDSCEDPGSRETPKGGSPHLTLYSILLKSSGQHLDDMKFLLASQKP